MVGRCAARTGAGPPTSSTPSPSPTPDHSCSPRPEPAPGSAHRPMGPPVAVEGSLGLDDPDDSAEEGEEDPEAGETAHRLGLACGAVHVADLGWHQEPVHEAQD